jgi:hypothetical protein
MAPQGLLLTYLLTYMARENRAPTVGANRLMGQIAHPEDMASHSPHFIMRAYT